MITRASMEEAKMLYKECIEKDFPDDEIPNYNQFIKLTQENIHTIYWYKQEDQNVAYFITVEHNNNILISHLAVIKEYRSKGIGKKLLEEIENYFANKNMLIAEVEAESRASNEEELEIIKRRKKYYLNLGFKQCMNMLYSLYNVEYDILTFSPKQIEYTGQEIKQVIEDIYSKVGLNKNMLKIEVK